MRQDDLLGDKGRAALQACVKIKIIGHPERRQYSLQDAIHRIWSCYTLPFPSDITFFPSITDGSITINDIKAEVARLDGTGRIFIYPNLVPQTSEEREAL